MTDERRPKREPAPLRGPFASRSPATRRRILWIAGAAALAIWIFLFIQDSQIKDSGGPGIIGFEVAGTEDQLVAAVAAADDAGEPVLLVGGGSNLLVADGPLDATAVLVRTRGVQVHGERLEVAAGEDWDGVVARAVDAGSTQVGGCLPQDRAERGPRDVAGRVTHRRPHPWPPARSPDAR